MVGLSLTISNIFIKIETNRIANRPNRKAVNPPHEGLKCKISIIKGAVYPAVAPPVKRRRTAR